MDKKILTKAAHIELIVFDVDGVFTDGRIILSDDGHEVRCFDVKDGTGVRLLLSSGIEVAIISARISPIVADRMENLGIQYIFQGCMDKKAVIDALLVELDLDLHHVAYMGDDLIDLPAMKGIGLTLAPADAHEVVRQHVDYVVPECGGRGAVRRACEIILQGHDLWEPIVSGHLNT